MINRLRRTVDLDRAVAPPFMSKTDHSTAETDRSSQYRTIHDDCKAPAESRPDSKAWSLKFRGRSLSRILHNGCEMSGRGSLPHMPSYEPASRLTLALGAATPVRLSPFFGGSSEGLAGS